MLRRWRGREHPAWESCVTVIECRESYARPSSNCFVVISFWLSSALFRSVFVALYSDVHSPLCYYYVCLFLCPLRGMHRLAGWHALYGHSEGVVGASCGRDSWMGSMVLRIYRVRMCRIVVSLFRPKLVRMAEREWAP